MYGRFIAETIVIRVRIVRGEVLHEYITEAGLDMIVDAVAAAGEIGIAPMVEAAEANIFVI